MANKSVDLTALRLITEHDEEMERELFADFFKGSEKNLEELEKHCLDGGDLDWCEQAHALKGAAKNLGAEKLSELCVKAQEMQIASEADRAVILEDIKKEYGVVKQYLKQVW